MAKAIPNPARVEVFRTHYETALAAAIEAHPENYTRTANTTVPQFAARMVDALAVKGANLSPTTQTVCKALGIPHKINAIAEWLCDAAPIAG